MNTVMSAQLLKQLRPQIEAALAAVAEANGIKIKCGNATFTTGTFSMKLEGVLEGGLTKEAQRFKMYAKECGMQPEWLGQEFEIMGRTIKVTGINTTLTKVFVDEVATGRAMMYPAIKFAAVINRRAAAAIAA